LHGNQHSAQRDSDLCKHAKAQAARFVSYGPPMGRVPYALDRDEGERLSSATPVILLAIPVLAIGLWLVLPDTPLSVAIIAVVVLLAVFGGVYRILSARRLTEAPARRPTTPPSPRPRG
jgi:hypothetical protein